MIGAFCLMRIGSYNILREELSLNPAYHVQRGNIYPSMDDIARLKHLTVLSHHRSVIQSQVNSSYIHTPKICNFTRKEGDNNVVILVKSATSNYGLRMAIRTTWGSVASETHNLKLFFLLAYNESSMQRSVDEEVKQYGDIVQKDFKDSYMNNTLKTIMSYDYVVRFCPQSNLILFIDDDFFMDINHFIKYVNAIKPLQMQNIFEGFLLRASVDRNPKSKWFISWLDYPYERWPPYLAGGAYLTSFDVVKKFHNTFPLVQHYGIDDAWLGIVAKTAGVIPRDNILFHNSGKFAHLALIQKCSHDPRDMWSMWKRIKITGKYHIPTYT